jgi:hypothetical protein
MGLAEDLALKALGLGNEYNFWCESILQPNQILDL